MSSAPSPAADELAALDDDKTRLLDESVSKEASISPAGESILDEQDLACRDLRFASDEGMERATEKYELFCKEPIKKNYGRRN